MSAGSYRVNAPTVASETVDGEVVMINLESGNYYSLRASGAAIWDAIEQGVPVADIADGLRRGYAVPDAAATLDAFLAELVADDLVLPDEPPAAARSWDPPALGADGFAPPQLEKFVDMQHLILLDPVHEVDEAEGWPRPRRDD